VTTAQDMAQAVKDYLNGKLDTMESNFMVQDNKTKSYQIEVPVMTLEEFM
jgi:hypothetical protein